MEGKVAQNMNNDFWLILSYFVIWTIIMVGSAYLFYKLPNKCYNPNSFIFREKKWERYGIFYEKFFMIKNWKSFLPDGGAIVKNGFRKKHLKTSNDEYLEQFLIESCRAEATHILPIILSFVFAFYNPINVVIIMFVFSLAVNLPCLITQRYNRIRINKILKLRKQKVVICKTMC